LGFILGMILAIFIGYFIFIQGRKVDIKPFFRWTTLLLVFLASGMIAYGSHEIESYLVKSGNLDILGIESKSDIQRPWDILEPTKEQPEENMRWIYSFNIKGKEKHTHLLHDSGRIGVFLKGFFGYNSNPNYVELIIWIFSLIIGIRFWRRSYASTK
jgi:high-affinity iron transporter